MHSVALLLSLAPTALATWSDGNADFDRPGRAFEQSVLDADVPTACFALCLADARCDSWVFQS